VIEMPFMAPARFVAGAQGDRAPGAAHWFVFCGERLLVELGPPRAAPSDDPRVPRRASWARLPRIERGALDALAPLRTLCFGHLAGEACWAAELPEAADAPPGLQWEGLRALFSVLDDALFALAGRALQLIDWDRSHRYCGRCGTPTTRLGAEHVRSCPACRLAAYPRVSPAVMALVRRGRELLLARSPHFPPGMYSALAGFVEPGETLEQCLRREVREEVGVDVTRPRYVASQPWPFPHSLMLAFVCDWTGGELDPQPGEIEAAAWFDVSRLPRLPSAISIARRLIDAAAAAIRDGRPRDPDQAIDLSTSRAAPKS
jgi:NAD+ diphosphatase